MEYRRLVRLALRGNSGWEQYPILLVRVSPGLFFTISGANKLFVAASRQTMYETLVGAKVPFPRLACVALLVDMLVAILTTKLSAMPKGLSPLNRLDDFLYLPEVLYVLFLSAFIGG
jgi:putative oxidoreductase